MFLFPARMKMIEAKMKALESSHYFSHCKSMGIFFRSSRATYFTVQGRIVRHFELIRDLIVVLVTCKNEEDPIKTEGTRVLTALSIEFSDAQGQLTLQPVVEFGRIQTHPYSD